ncbi:MAG: peptide-N-glycosidase F-related protein, partial [Flavobacteriales bacterium]
FTLGGACSWVNYYHGSIDEFAIFNSVLSADEIQQLMLRDLDTSHPQWNHVQVYYPFNENNGEQIQDASGNNRHAWMLGNAAHLSYEPQDQWRNVNLSNLRPAIQLTSGAFTVHTDTTLVTELVQVPPVSIAEYGVSNYRPELLNVTYAWQEQNAWVLDELGDVVDSIWIPADTILLNDTITYWQRPFEIIDRYELNRFITMYGIQLTLGTDGWTWVVDVTDWEPLLRDSVELESGNWQELLDMKFVFIEGPSPRDIKRVERVWDTNQGLANFDNVVTTKTIEKLPNEAGWKLLTTNTGHQFDNPFYCAEFCSNVQTVEVNGQAIASWDIMQECADNPLYPQGGTWIYDRAGWCPGMNSTTKEFELTPHVNGSDSFDLDYDIQYNDYGNYVFFGTLIGYGAPNQQIDPEIDMVTAPSDWKIHSRWNPICDEAKFTLRNKGAQPLTHVKIEYGVSGGATESFDWTGSLDFMEREEVTLTYHDPIMYTGSAQEQLTFFIRLVSTNDGADENLSNNEAHSAFHRPVVYGYTNLDDNRLIIQLKTNNANTETSYTLYDIAGNVVFERSDFPLANTTYRDTIAINAGCYMFHLKDMDDDGL